MSNTGKVADAPPMMDFAMTELEERLFGEEGASVAAAILDQLSTREKELSMFLKSGPTAADYERAQAGQKAIAAARAVLRCVCGTLPTITKN